MSKTAQVRSHLSDIGPLTAASAAAFYGVTNLSSVVAQIRKRDFGVERRTAQVADGGAKVHEYAKAS